MVVYDALAQTCKDNVDQRVSLAIFSGNQTAWRAFVWLIQRIRLSLVFRPRWVAENLRRTAAMVASSSFRFCGANLVRFYAGRRGSAGPLR